MKKTKYNSQNELIKTKFFGMLENAKGRDPKTVDSYVKAIHEFEVYSNFLDFKKFNTKLAVGFKEYLSDKKNKRTGQNISKSYLHNPKESDHRTDYEIDRCKVVHSYVFRRLQGKIQIVSGTESDFHRNRLTHSLEVASIAKSIYCNIRKRRTNKPNIKILCKF